MANKKPIGAVLVGIWIPVALWVVAQSTGPRPIVLEKRPVRVIGDPYPALNGIAVDEERREVIVTDDNTFSVLTYGSLFQPSPSANEPRRKIAGPNTHLGFVCSVTISPEAQEIYTVDADWKDNMAAFAIDADGDVAPKRELNVDHGTWGIFLDRKNDELVLSTEHINKVSVYRRMAEGDEEPLRFIQGPNTGLADPHGVFVDAQRDEIFVANHGYWHRQETGSGSGTLFFGGRTKSALGSSQTQPLGPSTGKFLPPSITIYSRTAEGDAAPVRTIQGSKTGLNWPNGIVLDFVSDQIVVANSGDDSVLFFDRKANGNISPARAIRGSSTNLDAPSGVSIDTKANELWVTNWDNHTATAYRLTDQGNVSPLRSIRSAPRDAPLATGFGNPGHVVFDPKRQEILVPN